MCMNWDKEIVLKPNYLAFISISLYPCDDADVLSFYGLEVDDECIADKEQQKVYLDPYSQNSYMVYLYYNYETFDSEK